MCTYIFYIYYKETIPGDIMYINISEIMSSGQN